MNQKIRKYLIDQCVLGEPIYYEEIGKRLSLNLALESDRLILKKTLGDISAYEHKNGRPLVSTAAIYKAGNGHGYGFYKLCQELDIGNAKKLRKKEFGFIEFQKSAEFWQNKTHYQKFFEIDDFREHSFPFFSEDEVVFFQNWANKVYNKENEDHFLAKTYLLETVWKKTQYWSNNVVNKLDDYVTSNPKYWQKLGKNNGATVSRFKHYTWARIFKKGDKKKNIFFTLGVDTEVNALVYKLDYFREKGSTLSPEQKELCQKHIPEETRWKKIPIENLGNYDWEKLINEVTNFIAQNSHHYDQIVNLTWGNSTPQEIFQNKLSLRDFPKGGFSEVPPYKPSFKGSKVDFLKKNREDKELGDNGEELVKDLEMEKLNQLKRPDLSSLVKIMEHGKGYDVLSFDEKGNEIYIEVKTTRGGEKIPFYLSINEKAFAQEFPQNYRIYRLYNYDYEMNNADYFIVENPFEQLLFEPINFRIYLKKN